MAIAYSISTNITTVTAHTEAVPANFTDIYNADKAGTRSLHARTGIAGTDGFPVGADRAERPADYIVLGGASNDLYITIANWIGTTATIRITGTDRDGAAQTEDIVVTANGTYYTTKWFKTITYTQVTAFTATSFDYDLTQGQWGAWFKDGNQFNTSSALKIGDGSTTTWFADEAKQVEFTGADVPKAGEGVNYDWKLLLKANSNFRLGKVEDATDKTTSNGCQIIFNLTGHAAFGTCLNSPPSTAKLELYSTTIVSIPAYVILIYGASGAKIQNCLFTDYVNPIRVYDSDVYNLIIENGIYGMSEVSGTVDKIVITHTGDAFTAPISTTTVSNVFCRNNSHMVYFSAPSGDLNLVNVDSDDWTMRYSATTTTYKAYRQYEVDLKVIDKDNSPINSATVKIWDKDSNLIVDTTTNASGVITTQTVTRGYYQKAYGSTLQEKSPHLIKIEKAGYTTYEADFTLEDKIDWLIALQTGGGLLRNPPMTGGMV